MSNKTSRKLLALTGMMGFASGLPVALIGGTLQVWMKREGIDLGTIGFLAWLGFPYTFKFVWAPFFDRYSPLQRFGRRRGWMLISQVLLVLSILILGLCNPKENLSIMLGMGLLVAFFSASQDIVIDAWRREIFSEKELSIGNSVHVTTYLFSFRMISGALALILADHLAWSEIYLIMAAATSVGIVATLLCPEPNVHAPPPKSMQEAIVEPLRDYFNKPAAWAILIFILLYKAGDNMAAQMTFPMYVDLGFTNTEIGAISKSVGWVSLALGSVIGGVVISKWKLMPAMIVFGILQAASTFGFSILSAAPGSRELLIGVISFENLTAGMGTTAFVTFMALITNKRFSATQYALLTSFMAVPSKILAGPTGILAKNMGYYNFFVFCTVIAIPGVLMIPWLARLREER